MDTKQEIEVLENVDSNVNENESKLNNKENDQDQPVGDNPDDKGENHENTNENKENLDGDITNEEINEEKTGAESGNVDNEEPEPSAPPDLVKVSEEIDEYITTLTNSSKDLESSPPPDVPVSVEQLAILVEALLDEYDSNDVPVKWDQLTDDDAASFLGAIDRMSKLLKALSEYSSEDKYSYSINTVSRILQRAMTYLEEEFRDFLEVHKLSVEDQNNNNKESLSKQLSTKGSNQEVEENAETEHEKADEKNGNFCGYPEETIPNLYKLAKTLMDGGHETECCQIYFIARRADMEEKLEKLGFEKHSIDDVHKMHWETLEKDIVSWNEAVKQFTNIYFVNEHKLTTTVFKDHSSIAEGLFSNLARGIIIQLLNFSEAVATTRRSAEKLFKYLDVYESVRDLHAKTVDLVSPECSNELKSETLLTRGRLGEAMIHIFFELENSIKSDSGKTPVPGGAVHPLTRYTMNYLEYACEYKDTLEQIFREHQKTESSDSVTGSDNDSNNFNPSQDQPQDSYNNNSNAKKQPSPFEIQIVNVMDLLHENILTKSKLYKDNPLSIIFLMNNCRYILQKIKACRAINGLLNDTWCRKRSSDLRLYHKNYQRETWSKLLNVLINHEGLLNHGKVSKPVLKERFKSFNAMFDEIIRTQTTWVIADEQLQSELRVSISNMVVPAYRSFMGRFSHTFTPGRQTEKYVKFQPEDVEARIDELFDGSAGATTNVGRWRM
ncbi:membrane traffic protein [Lithospermum erythrorhizon]|uniref:Exocyst subunit Exo70 family protein n=1 Tax=Lithospermum erythrorhizon TaxID=34254 RepID=A0AAV3PGQ6_LITER